MYTNKMRFTGLSGIDTQSMVEQLMAAESMKLHKLQRSTQLLTWKQEAYRSTASALKTFQNDFLNLTSGLKMRNPSSYSSVTYTAKINGADSDAVKLTTTTGVKAGTYKVEVSQLAAKDLYAGGKEFGGEMSSSPTGTIKAGDTFNVTLDGTTKRITISEDDLSGNLDLSNSADLEKFADIMQSKLNTAFGNSKITVNGDNSKLSFSTDKGHKFSIGEALGRDTKITATGEAFEKLSEDTQVSFTVGEGDTAKNIEVDLTKDMTAADVVKAINKKLSEEEVKNVSFSVNSDGKIVVSNPNSSSDVKISNADSLSEIGFENGSEFTIEKTNIMGELGIVSGTATDLSESQKLSDIFGSDNVPASVTINGKLIEIEEDETLKSFMSKVNAADTGVKLSFDSISRKFSIESTSTGETAKINMDDNFKNMFGFTTATTNAQDARFSVNGVETTRPSNSVDVNGLKLTLNATTNAGEVIELKVSEDNSTTLDNIKKFIEGYNEVIGRLNQDVSASRIRNSSGIAYQPLTDDEKQAMSESEISLWEEKAKTGLLYRDDILSKVMSELRTNVYKSVELSNGKKLSLHEIGITTSSSYNDGGKLVIDEDKLMKALEEHGDDITELFTKSSDYSYSDKKNYGARLNQEGIAERINDIINDAVGSSGSIAQRAGFENTLSATQNDLYKQLKSDYNRMEDLRVYLYNKETYYYNMFAKMEAAMNQSSNQMSYLQAQLGQ